jgi:hypothetical protein
MTRIGLLSLLHILAALSIKKDAEKAQFSVKETGPSLSV